MTTQALRYEQLPQQALLVGDTTPDPGKVGVQAWSTTVLCVMAWDGVSWQQISEITRGRLLAQSRSRPLF